jgi:hypothetical protein
MSTFVVTRDSVRALKAHVATRMPNVGSAHLSEIIAAALGYKTHAALNVRLRQEPYVDATPPEKAAAVARMRELGYNETWKIEKALPDPLRHRDGTRVKELTTERGKAWRNLMVAAVNECLQRGHIGRGPTDNFWPGAAAQVRGSAGTYQFDCVLFGLPARIRLSDIGCGEVTVAVELEPTNCPDRVYSNARHKDPSASASTWLERELGVWIQQSTFDFRCRRDLQKILSQANVTPNGFSDRGKTMM